MTTRLKILSIGLAFSIIYAVYDWYDRNNIGSSKTKQVVSKKKPKGKDRPRTAKAGRGRAKNRALANAAKQKDLERSKQLAESELTDVSEEILNLEGWSRNPFISVAQPVKVKPRAVIQEPIIEDFPKETVSEITFQEEELTGVESLNIETVASVGEKVFVIINGQRLREGDLINNLLIESIDNQKITFKMGNTTIIKDVGS
jgi:hypothetical protein|tara:strand:+ start:605 stop:1210 length:606 start_codon:yes stop_codon:yes gene_type:complete